MDENMREDAVNVAGLIDDYIETKYPDESKVQHLVRGAHLAHSVYVAARLEVYKLHIRSIRHGNQKAN